MMRFLPLEIVKEPFKLEENGVCQLNGVLLTLGDKPTIKLINIQK